MVLFLEFDPCVELVKLNSCQPDCVLVPPAVVDSSKNSQSSSRILLSRSRTKTFLLSWTCRATPFSPPPFWQRKTCSRCSFSAATLFALKYRVGGKSRRKAHFADRNETNRYWYRSPIFWPKTKISCETIGFGQYFGKNLAQKIDCQDCWFWPIIRFGQYFSYRPKY